MTQKSTNLSQHADAVPSPRLPIHPRQVSALLALFTVSVFATGCLQTLGMTKGPGSTHYDITIRQYIKGEPMGATTDTQKSDDGRQLTTGGGNININIVPVGDSVIETQDDNSAAKNAVSTPSATIVP